MIDTHMLNTKMDRNLAVGYKSASQIARRVTESWVADNLYCCSCDHSNLKPTPPNFQAIDFGCENCSASYQLKASMKWGMKTIPDGAYDSMMRALRSDKVPNLLLMHYSSEWSVENLVVIPSFFFSPKSIKKRNPLGQSARRAGWIGCNILLDKIADDGKIPLITGGHPRLPKDVRNHYDSIRPLSRLSAAVRGWTLDVLTVISKIHSPSFEIADVYKFEGELSKSYPSNKNVKAKIRQQLQILRDLGFIEFLGNGRYHHIR